MQRKELEALWGRRGSEEGSMGYELRALVTVSTPHQKIVICAYDALLSQWLISALIYNIQGRGSKMELSEFFKCVRKQ